MVAQKALILAAKMDASVVALMVAWRVSCSVVRREIFLVDEMAVYSE